MVDATLHVLGREVDEQGLDEVVDRFRSCADVIAGLVLPWDRPADAEALDAPASAARAGTLWSDTAECRWRLEADRALVTILADEPIEGLELEEHQVEIADEPVVAWVRRPESRGADVGAMHPRLYLADGAPAHRRLVATRTED